MKIKEMKEKFINKVKNLAKSEKETIKLIANILLVLMLLIILNVTFIDNIQEMIALYRTYTIFFSATLFYLIFIILATLTKRTNRAVVILSVLILLLTTVSNIKYTYTGTPLYISDVSLTGNLGEIATLADDFLAHIPYQKLLFSIISLLIVNLIARKVAMEINGKPRIITLVASSIVTILLVAPISIKDNFLLNYLYKQYERIDYNIDVNIMSYYKKYGVIGGIYETIIENRFYPPAHYQKAEIDNVLASTTPTDDTSLGQPNIIVMFQESYWDIQKLDEITFDKDITGVFNQLKQEGDYINMISPTYGGCSANVEFELLTGGNMTFFNKGYLPFVQMYRDKRSINNPSIIQELKKNGYYTKVVFGRDFYLSEPVYRNLGIDEYINAFELWDDYEEKVKGDHLSDEALVDAIIYDFENKDKDEKLFYMTATIETHMPFDPKKYDTYDIQVVDTKLNEKDTGTILAYAQGVYDSNRQLQRLYDYIQTLDEPTMILFFGDHLPILYNSEGKDLLLNLGYFQTGDSKQDIFRKYNTEAVILNNYGGQVEFESECISPDLLLTTVINQMNIEVSPYYQWLYNASKDLPAMNQFIYADKDGNIGFVDSVDGYIREVYEQRRNVQYGNFMQKGK